MTVVAVAGHTRYRGTDGVARKWLREFRGQRANDCWNSRGPHLYRKLSHPLCLSLSLPPISPPILPTLCFPDPPPFSSSCSYESKNGSGSLSGGRHVFNIATTATTTVAAITIAVIVVVAFLQECVSSAFASLPMVVPECDGTRDKGGTNLIWTESDDEKSRLRDAAVAAARKLPK